MTDFDPIEIEQRRRAAAIELTNRERLKALGESDLPSKGEDSDRQVVPEGLDPSATVLNIRAVREDMERRLDAALQLQTPMMVEWADGSPRFVQIGGWQAGNNDQDLQSTRFEIEAERALFLGRGAPPVAFGSELQLLHASLSEMHSRYQRTGDPSMLIGIADMTAQYNKAMAEIAQRKHP